MYRRTLVVFGWSSLSIVGCAPRVADPVQIVPTRTPGVTFVIVRPGITMRTERRRVQPRDNEPVDQSSEFVLLCDARPVDGMHCTIPVEAALARVSYTPRTGKASAPIDEGVGTLADLWTHVTKEPAEGRGDDAPARATLPTVPAAPVVPTPVPGVDPTKEEAR